ncbi:MAG: UvrD-helicase domain-containing protein [Muribaculaceae bacterium]|nr:UvrD-helicase domain-containing protein [Muribaculaceae bacterium]
MSNTSHSMLMIKASAGSGKTFNLALRYIEQLLFSRRPDGLLELRSAAQRQYHRHILAITFTNKATDEMKRRIVDELFTLSLPGGDSKYLPYFKANCTPEAFAKIHEHAAQALNDVLFAYSAFNVSTIDSFFQSVMRAFARELDRDYNYEVQIDAGYAMKVAVHNFLLSLGSDAHRMGGRESEVDRWVKNYIGERVSASGDWAFFNNGDTLASFAKIMETELFRQHMGQVRKYLSTDDGRPTLMKIARFRKWVQEVSKSLAERYACLPQDFARLLQKHGLDTAMVKGNSTAALYIKEMSVDKKLTEKFLALDGDGLAGCFQKGTNLGAQAVDDLVAFKKTTVGIYYFSALFNKLVNNLAQLGLVGQIDEKLEEYRRETNSILLADTNDLIGKVIEGGVNFVYERVGTWINHYMIDEFQDTSRKQYDNFKPLLSESLSNGHFNLVIGDSKQSIYRFRNADPSLFRQKVQSDFADYVQLDPLDTNYRSLGNVVTFNNKLLRAIVARYAHRELVDATYRDDPGDSYVQKVNSGAEQMGMVRLATADCRLETLKASGSGEEQKYAQILSMLPQYLLKLHERYRWGEIGILVNTNDEGSAVVRTLLDHNRRVRGTNPDLVIDVVSDESMKLAGAASVRRIVSVLRFIDLTQYAAGEDGDDGEESHEDRDRDTLRRRMMKNRLKEQRKLSVMGNFVDALEAEGEVTAERAGELLQRCFDNEAQLAQKSPAEQQECYAALLGEILPDAKTEPLNLVNVVEKIIARYLLAETMPETAYILAFQDVVADFGKKNNGGTVREFLRFWDTKGGDITVGAAANENAIRVMTIHKAKGLEFWCQVVPFVDWAIEDTGRQGQYWMERDVFLDGCADVLNLVPKDDEYAIEKIVPPLLPIDKPTALALRMHCERFKHFIDRQLDETLLDNLNKTYVALTRPCMEMHLFLYSESKDSAGALLARAMEQVEGLRPMDPDSVPLLQPDDPQTQKNLEENGGATGWWQYGEEPTAEFIVEERKKKLAKEPVVVTERMERYDVVTAAGRVQVKLDKEMEDMRDRGNRLHRLLSLMHDENDVDYAVRYAQGKGLAAPGDTVLTPDEVQTLLTDMMKQAAPMGWFDARNKVYNEQSLAIHGRNGTEIRRPDRVVQRPDGSLVVVDYKFGAPEDRHVGQVRGYAGALHVATGRPVTGYLWYPLRHKIEQVV